MKYFSNEIQYTLNNVAMTSEDVTESAKKYQEALTDQEKEKYKEQVIDGTMRLVYKTCSTYGFTATHFDDAFQYGVIGVLEALERFDTKLDIKFSTYATYWIKHYLNLAKNEITTIKLPRDNHIASSKYDTILGMEISNGITETQAAKKFGVTKKNLKKLKKEHTLSSRLRYVYNTDSSASTKNPDKLFSGEILKDKSLSHVQRVENKDLLDRVKIIAHKHLKTKEYQVFKEKFLSEDGEIKPNLEIAKNLDIPYSSINDILNRAIRKIRVKIKNGD